MTVSGTATTTNYILHGKNIVHMTRGSTALHFWYDAQNRPAIVLYGSTRYAYVHNLQGDIVGIIDSAGTEVVKYTYDAWGKVLSTTGSLASTLGTVQPFRYRGYVYDVETGLYYLRSRYYNPNINRFINADINLGDNNILFHNVYIYCINNPINYFDPDGLTIEEFIDKLKEMFLGGGNCLKTYSRGMSIETSYQTGVPNPGGRLGGPEHRATTQGIANAANGENSFGESASDYGYTVTTEQYVPNIKNGYKSTRFGDVAIIPQDAGSTGAKYIFQVGRVTLGGRAVAREQRAISDIESKGYIVIFVPYNQ